MAFALIPATPIFCGAWGYRSNLSPFGKSGPDIPILKEAKAEYAKCVLSDAMSRRVQVPLAPK